MSSPSQNEKSSTSNVILARIPTDVLILFFQSLSMRELRYIGLVDREWRYALNKQQAWKGTSWTINKNFKDYYVTLPDGSKVSYLVRLHRSFPHIRKLRFDYHSFADSDYEFLKQFKHLESIETNALFDNSDDGSLLHSCVSLASSLKVLRIDLHSVSDEGAGILAKNLVNLEQFHFLELHICQHFQGNYLGGPIHRPNATLTNKGLEALSLAVSTKLSQFTFHISGYTIGLIALIRNLKYITNYALFSYDVHDIVPHLVERQSLKQLTLCGTIKEINTLDTLVALKNLESISLQLDADTNWTFPAEQFAKLASLTLDHRTSNDRVLSNLARHLTNANVHNNISYSSLQQLNLTGIHVTDKGIIDLNGCTQYIPYLYKISLIETKCTGATMPIIAKFKQLVTLILHNNNSMVAADLIHLRPLPKLRDLEFIFANIRNVNSDIPTNIVHEKFEELVFRQENRKAFFDWLTEATRDVKEFNRQEDTRRATVYTTGRLPKMIKL